MKQSDLNLKENLLNEITNSQESYNETQLKLFSGAEGFVTTNGGGAMLCGYFKKPVIVYILI